MSRNVLLGEFHAEMKYYMTYLLTKFFLGQVQGQVQKGKCQTYA